jgi:membrane protein YfhO
MSALVAARGALDSTISRAGHWNVAQRFVYPAIIVGTALLFFAPALGAGQITVPLDILGYMYPWNASASNVFGHALPQNALLQDLLTLMTPWFDFAWHEWRQGRIPLWNPYQIGGMPFLANDESAVLFPMQLVAMLFPIAIGLQFQMVAEMAGAGLGMYAYLRAIRLSPPAACVGALALMLSGFFTVWIDYPLVAVAMWLPWALLSCEKLITGRNWVRWTIALALFTACHLLAGHIQTSIHVLATTAMYALFRIMGQGWRRRHDRLVWRMLFARTLPVCLGISMGIMLAAVQLLPTLQYVRESYTFAFRQSAPPETPQPIGNLASWLIPDIGGNPAYNALYPSQTALNGAYFNYNERTAYVGIPILVLGVLALAHPRRRFRHFGLIFAALSVLAAGVAYGISPIYPLVIRLPGLREVNHNRLILVVAFGLVVLGSIGFEALLILTRNRARSVAAARRTSSVLGGICVAACVLLIVCAVLLSKEASAGLIGRVAGHVSEDGTVVAWLRAWTLWAGGVLVVSLLLIAAALTRNIEWRLGGFAIALLIVGDLLVVGERSYPRVAPDEYYPPTSVTDQVSSFGREARLLVGQGDWHVRPPILMPNVATAYRIRDMSVYEALIAYRAPLFMNLINQYGPNRDQPTVLVPNYAPDYHTLAIGGVTHVLMPRPEVAPPGSASYLTFQVEAGADDQPLTPLQSGDTAALTFVDPTDDLSAIGVVVQADAGARGTLMLSLTNEQSGTVAHAEADLTSRGPDGALVLPFAPVADSAGRQLTASLTLRSDESSPNLVRLVGNPAGHVDGVQQFRNGEPVPGVLRFRLYRSEASSGLQQVWSDDEFTILALQFPRPRAYVADNVVAAVDGSDALARLHALHVPGSDAVVENPGSLSSAGGSAVVASDEPGDIVVQTSMDRPGVLVLDEGFGDGGWNVKVDDVDATLLRANYLFQGVAVPSGNHIVHFTYWPRALTAGLVVSLMATSGLIGLGFWALTRKRRRRGPRCEASLRSSAA